MIPGGVVLRRRSAMGCVDLGILLLRADTRVYLWSFVPFLIVALGAGLALLPVAPWAAPLVVRTIAWLGQAPLVQIAGTRAAGLTPEVIRPLAGLTSAGRLLLATLPYLALISASCIFPLGTPILMLMFLFLPEVALLEQPPSGVLARMTSLGSKSIDVALSARAWLLGLELYITLGAELLGVLMIELLLGIPVPWGHFWELEVSPVLLLGLIMAQPVCAMVRLAFYLSARTKVEALDVYFGLWKAVENPS